MSTEFEFTVSPKPFVWEQNMREKVWNSDLKKHRFFLFCKFEFSGKKMKVGTLLVFYSPLYILGHRRCSGRICGMNEAEVPCYIPSWYKRILAFSYRQLDPFSFLFRHTLRQRMLICKMVMWVSLWLGRGCDTYGLSSYRCSCL